MSFPPGHFFGGGQQASSSGQGNISAPIYVPSQGGAAQFPPNFGFPQDNKRQKMDTGNNFFQNSPAPGPRPNLGQPGQTPQGHFGQAMGQPGQAMGQPGHSAQGGHQSQNLVAGQFPPHQQQSLPGRQNYQTGSINQNFNTVNNSGPSYNLYNMSNDTELRSMNLSPKEFSVWFPNLGPMSFVHQMSTIGALVKMELKAKENNKYRPAQQASLQDRLRDNVDIITEDQTWPAEVDNKYSLLHSIRFDRSPIIGSEKVFQMAAQRYKPGDILPISAYDLTCLGLSDVLITNKGSFCSVID